MNDHPVVQFLEAAAGLAFAGCVIYVGWILLHPRRGGDISISPIPVPVATPFVPQASPDEINADLKRCTGITKAMHNVLGAIVYGISTDDADSLAEGEDADQRLEEMISPDQTPISIRALSQHAKFVNDTAAALILLEELAEDGANFWSGASEMKQVDIQREESLTARAVITVNHDLRAYRSFARSLSSAQPP